MEGIPKQSATSVGISQRTNMKSKDIYIICGTMWSVGGWIANSFLMLFVGIVLLGCGAILEKYDK